MTAFQPPRLTRQNWPLKLQWRFAFKPNVAIFAAHPQGSDMNFFYRLLTCTMIAAFAGCSFSTDSTADAEGDNLGQGPVANYPGKTEEGKIDDFANLLRDHIDQSEARQAAASQATLSGEGPHRQVADPYYLVGQRASEWDVGEWANTSRQAIDLADLKGRVVVVHWWTDDSDYSAKTLSVLQKLADEFSGRPVQFVGLYHSKGSYVDKDWRIAVQQANAWGVDIPIAYDRDWRTLNDWWRSRLNYLPTTPTFVINGDGRIVHLHPGPVFYPTDDPLKWQCNEDYLALRAAILKAIPQNLADTQRDADGA